MQEYRLHANLAKWSLFLSAIYLQHMLASVAVSLVVDIGRSQSFLSTDVVDDTKFGVFWERRLMMSEVSQKSWARIPWVVGRAISEHHSPRNLYYSSHLWERFDNFISNVYDNIIAFVLTHVFHAHWDFHNGCMLLIASLDYLSDDALGATQRFLNW